MLLEFISKKLILTTDYILSVAETASSKYRKFPIPKKDGGTRIVYQPNNELKCLQRLIHDELLNKLPIHSACTAYTAGASVLKNALLHRDKKYLLHLDFTKFFESITASDIHNFLHEKGVMIDESWNDDDSKLLMAISCMNGRLTMGAVTSPMLSNAICYKFDETVNNYCLSQGITYSRYADDMYFSTNRQKILFSMPGIVKKSIKSISYPQYLKLNDKKTVHSSKKRNMSVTGLVLTNDGNISIGRDKKRKIRALIHNWHNLSEIEKKYLKGYLSYCKSVEPLFINALCKKYTSDLIAQIQTFEVS